MHKGKIMSKSEFIKAGEFAKEEYGALIVAADTEKGLYNIGLQLSEDKILLLEQTTDKQVHERYHELAPQITEIQRQYRVNRDLSSYIE